MVYKLGQNACAYVSGTPITANADPAHDYTSDIATALTSLTPVMIITGDVTADVSNNYTEFNTRQSAATGWGANIPGLTKGTGKFKIANVDADANFLILYTGWKTKTPIFAALLDGPSATNGSKGIAGNFYVDFSENQPGQGPGTFDVTLLAASPNTYYKKASS